MELTYKEKELIETIRLYESITTRDKEHLKDSLAANIGEMIAKLNEDE